MSTTESRPHPASLRRAVGLPTASATSTGLAFAAIDYLGVVSIASFAPGTSAWLAIAIAMVLALLVSGIFSELNGLFPSAAGIRLYIGRALGSHAALWITLAYMTTVIMVIAADAFLIGSAIGHVLGEPSSLTYLWILALLGGATVANLAGVKIAGSLQAVITYLVLAATTALSLVAIFGVKGPFPHLFSLFGKSSFDGFEAIAFGVFVFAAFEWVTTTAEEMRSPAVVTKALFASPFLLMVAAGLFAVALLHALPFSQVHHSTYPQLLLGKVALGSIGELWALAITLLTAVNTFNGGFLVASRFLYAAARDRSLPRLFAKLNLRAIPWVSVVALGSASAAVAAIVFAVHGWLLLVSLGAAMETGIYAVACYCVFALRRSYQAERPFRLRMGRGLAVLGMVVFALLTLAASFSDPWNPRKLSVVPAAVIAGLCLVSFGYVRVVVPRITARAEARRIQSEESRPKRRPARHAS